MKRFVSIFSLLVVFYAAYVWGLSEKADAVPADHRDNKTHCVNTYEWNHVDAGMNEAGVIKLFDWAGEWRGRFVRWYRACGYSKQEVIITVSYNRGVVELVEWWEPDTMLRQNTQSCVIPAEWSQLHKGMSKAEAVEILDGAGTFNKYDGSRYWQICDKPYGHARVFLYFSHSKVVDGMWVVASGVVMRATNPTKEIA